MNTRTRTLQLLAVLVFLTGVFVLADIASACPTCKQALLENDPQQQSLVSGYFYSILFMMAMPFAILGTFGGFAFLAVRRAGKRGDRTE